MFTQDEIFRLAFGACCLVTSIFTVVMMVLILRPNRKKDRGPS